MINSRTAVCYAISGGRHFRRHAFYSRSTKRGRLRYSGGWKMLWSAVHGREYTPVALLIPTRAFLRTRTRRESCSCATCKSRGPVAIAPIAHSPLLTSFFPLSRVSHPSFFISSLFPGYPVSFRQVLPSRSPDNKFESLFVTICVIYLTVRRSDFSIESRECNCG